ncbi:Nin one binding Zn-ribbon like-domain-containing protein [Mycena polygramma]|nr:Nin one binding Zn-ribbon like-domain-containing protein [Mycena polygramma]
MSTPTPRCKNLVLDAGPLLSLSPLRGLAETYLTVPQVLAELKDKRAREHFERLGLSAGVKIQVVAPDAASLAAVIQGAKKTGDYAVLSHPDLCVLALTYGLHQREKAAKANESANKPDETAATPTEEPTAEAVPANTTPADESPADPAIDENQTPLDAEDGDSDEAPEDNEDEEDEQDLEPLDVELQSLDESSAPPPPDAETDPLASPPSSPEPLFEDPSDDDDGEGEWITPGNVALHKSRALELLSGTGAGKGKGKEKRKEEEDEVIGAGCMTADFAMQNVLLQMGLNLVGVEGKRIQKVKSWVLRCHACFKICKDNTKKFCPSCGNATLLRASVTVSSPGASADAPTMQVHLKPNFQYRLRGTKYAIPAPKPGSAKTGPGEGLILREDQTQYVRAKKMADGRREREEVKMNKGILSREGGGVGSWLDPDWAPEMLSVGAGGKGRTMRAAGMDGDLPAIGYGRKNPNERRKKRK